MRISVTVGLCSKSVLEECFSGTVPLGPKFTCTTANGQHQFISWIFSSSPPANSKQESKQASKQATGTQTNPKMRIEIVR